MKPWPFDSVLIANRGEIALRIIGSVKALGLRSIAVFSDADREAPHVRAADRAVRIGPALAAQSYLNGEAIIAAAQAVGAGAIHPGYGFLSENATFAQACTTAGIVFVGPSAEAIRVMGDKRLAKERMQAAGVPCIPGYLGEGQDIDAFVRHAREVGYPVMIKAAAGGGGRGMRLVTEEKALATAVESAASEARNAFGDGTLYLEKALHGARHVEVQIIADRHGNTLHLGERDCSIQRRHQKIVEETPSPAVTPPLRAQLTADAVAAAQAISYENAGTVEFLLDATGRYYFLEMNTRLQVEHPVTELVTGLDLVELQLRIAAGERLPLAQADVVFAGHAIEARLYAEDPEAGFLPQTGRIAAWACAEGVRTDAGIAPGQEIGSYYDPMLAKIVAHGRDREEARRRLAAAVERTIILGVGTNKDYLARILRHEAFAAGMATTAFIDSLEEMATPEPPTLRAVAALLFCWPQAMSLAEWRRAGEGRWCVRLPGEPVQVTRQRSGQATVRLGESVVGLDPLALDGSELLMMANDIVERIHFCRQGDSVQVAGLGVTRRYREIEPNILRGKKSRTDGKLKAPISGRVVKIGTPPGEAVQADTCVMVIEAMKMEYEIRSSVAGVCEAIHVELGAQVDARQLLATVKPIEEATAT